MWFFNSYRASFLLLFLFASFTRMDSQTPAITPAIIEPLVGENDPTQFCYRNMVIDESGRLWMNTCGVAERFYALQILQFDGYDRWPVTVARDEWKDYIIGSLEGVSEDGLLYGFLNRPFFRATLYTYDVESNAVNYTPLPEGIIGGIIADRDGKFWVFGKTKTAFNIYQWDGQSLQLHITIPNTSQYSIREQNFNNRAKSNFVYQDSTFWIFDRDLPIIAYHQPTKSVRRYTEKDFPGGYLKNPEQLENHHRYIAYLNVWDSSVYVVSMHLDKQVYVMNLKEESPSFTPVSFIPKNAITKSIWKDEQGNLLFVYEYSDDGKRKNGAYLLDKNKKVFDYSTMLADLPLVSFVIGKDFKRQVYFSTANGAFFVQANQQSSIAAYPGLKGLRHICQTGSDEFIIRCNEGINGLIVLKDGELQALSDETCFGKAGRMIGRRSFLKDPKGFVWVKDESMLYRASPDDDGTCISHALDFNSNFAVFLTDHKVAFIERDSNYLFVYDLETQKKDFPSNTPIQFEGIVHYTWLSENNILWVASNEGLYKVDLKTGDFKHFGDSEDFEDHRILVIHEDRQGRLWLGTANRGIHVFDPKKEEVVLVINETVGLSNNVVVGILEDNDGDIWAATYNGMSLIHPSGEIITILNEKDGFTHPEFNRFAHFKSEDGRLFFGTISGLNVLDPKKIKEALEASEAIKVFITRFSYFDPTQARTVHLRNYKPGNAPIVLSADKRYLSVSVGMSNYGQNANNRYAYQLEGLQKDWSYLGAEHMIRLPNLPAGKYNLLIAGIDQNGNWTSNTIRIPIHAKEFFYKQSWFYLLCALPFLVFGLIWIQRLRSERNRLEQEVQKRTVEIQKDKELIQQQASELQQLDEMKSRFFANISHDLRTPITLISGPAELLAEEEEVKQKSTFQKAVTSIRQNSKKLLNLIDEIMDLARLESNTIKLHEEPIPLVEFTDSIFESYLPEAQRKQLQFKWEVQIDRDYQLLTDPNRLEKILNNLLSNALKFTAQGDQIKLGLFEKEGQIIFEVADTGRGIPEADLPHIFERYFQSKDEKLVQTSGSGIGLSLCMEFAKLLEGQLSVESIYGKGSTFRLSVPAKQSMDHSTWQNQVDTITVPKATSPKINGTIKDKPKIMVVEDNPDVQSFLKDILEAEFEVSCFDDGQAALDFLLSQKAKSLPTDLILSDINMPRLDGYGLIEAVKKDDQLRQLPLIMLTARLEERSKLQALRMGVDDYLTKPFSPVELKVRIKNILDNYQKRLAYQEEYYKINPHFEDTPSADQTWLQELEGHALEALTQGLELQISYLADKMALSSSQVGRKVKLLTGMTIGKYIQEIKLQKARHLLEQKAYLTVAEVGFASGFNSASYFSKVFVEYFGKSPTAYL